MVRFKNRYITIEIICPSLPENTPLTLKSGAFHESVMNKIQYLHGDYGVAAVRTGFIAKYCNENTRIAILRARHGPHKFVTSSLPFITRIGKLDVILHTIHVGATLKHSFKFIQRYQRAFLDSVYLSLKSDKEKKQMEFAVMDFTKTDCSLNIARLF